LIQEGLQLASGNYNFSTVCIQEVSLIVSNYFQETMFSVQENEITNHNLLISRVVGVTTAYIIRATSYGTIQAWIQTLSLEN